MNYLRFLQAIKLPVMFCHSTFSHPVTTSASVFKVRYLNPNIILRELVGVVGERKKIDWCTEQKQMFLLDNKRWWVRGTAVSYRNTFCPLCFTSAVDNCTRLRLFYVDNFCFFCINAVSLPIYTNTSQQILCMWKHTLQLN